MGEGWQRPGEAQREVVLVGRLLVVGEPHDGVLEGQQHSGIDVEGKVKIDGAAAALLGVEIDLPDLAKRVGLDEVALVVDVEPVIDRVVLEIGDVSGHVDGCHEMGAYWSVAALISGVSVGAWTKSPW